MFAVIVFLLLNPFCFTIELVPKLVRWPTHLDHYLCRRLHSGLGLRSHAVMNLSGELCRTYCRIIDRMGGKITYSENVSPNFIRCGPYQARCVDGACVGNNFPNSPQPNVDQTIPGGEEISENSEMAEISGNQVTEIPLTTSSGSVEGNTQEQ